MADQYPNLRHVNNRFSNAYDKAEMAVVTGTAKAGWWLGKKTAQAAWGLTKTTGKVGAFAASGVGTGALKASSYVGRTAISSVMSSNPLKNPLGVLAKGAYKLGGKMVNYTPGERVYDEASKKIIKKAPSLKLSKFGAGVLVGSSIIGSAMSAMNKFETDRMGTVDTQATTATPDARPQEYNRTFQPVDHAGATGDLVFALFKNRHGGSLL